MSFEISKISPKSDHKDFNLSLIFLNGSESWKFPKKKIASFISQIKHNLSRFQISSLLHYLTFVKTPITAALST